MHITCCDAFELEDGKIKRFDCYPEGSVILAQLGVLNNLDAALSHTLLKEPQMKSASELLEAYLNNVSTPRISADQFAEDGVLELPWVQARAQGPRGSRKTADGPARQDPRLSLQESDLLHSDA